MYILIMMKHSWYSRYPELHPKSRSRYIFTTAKILVPVCIIGFLAATFFIPPFRGSKKIIEVKKGDSLTHIANVLRKENLILSKTLFIIAGKLTGASRKIKTGEYLISPKEPPFMILSKLVKGKALLHRVTIPEGATMYDVARLLEENHITDKREFLQKVSDRNLLDSLGIEGKTAEGFLFPDTYFFRKNTSAEEVIKVMVKNFWDHFDEKMRRRAQEIGMSVFEVVILASIIEKETGVDDERPLISAVFHNRLKKGMLLQADPTVIYGLKKFGGNLTRKDLRTRNPYNTYIYRGLPPGPISNPGLSSLLAALYPADVKYLYFVARGDGTHDFSVTLKEHNRKVFEYQIKPYLRSRQSSK